MTIPEVSPALPSPTWRAVLAALGRLPQGAMSRSFGRVADAPIPTALRRPVLGAFARSVGIDLSEAERPLVEYGSVNELFVRRLRRGARSWPADPSVVASPVDGVVGQVGRIADGRLVQAKGRWYSAAELLGSEEEATRFEGGGFVTLYLSPRHYHRIHSPAGGVIRLARHVPGGLLPVNEAAVSHVADLFARNERLLCHIDSDRGRIALVAVGAYNVGRISAAFDPDWNAPSGAAGWVTNRRGPAPVTHTYDPPVAVERGGEVMAFHLGSTVVLLLEPSLPAIAEDLRTGAEIRLGDAVSEPA